MQMLLLHEVKTIFFIRRHYNLEALKIKATNEDADLVKRCRAGDGAAWEEIVLSYSRKIFNLAYRFTSSVEEAEDLTQEVFIRVYKSLSQYDRKRGNLSSWLMRIARNLIIDDYRRQQRNPQNAMADTMDKNIFHLRTLGSSAQKDIEMKELCTQVQKGIDKLSSDLRICVILRDIEELSYKEISEILQIPEGTVKSRINRGRIKLAKILKRMRAL